MGQAISVKKKIVWREFVPALVIVANSLIWYALTYSQFQGLITNGYENQTFTQTLLFGAYYASIAISAVIGSLIFPRARKKGLIIWMLLGTLMSIVLSIFPTDKLPVNLLISTVLGVSIGIGLPSALSYFADAAHIGKRGVQGGITWSMVGFGILSIGVLLSIFGPSLESYLLAVWRIIGLVFFLALSWGKQEPVDKKQLEKYGQILARREIILYLVPWVMFSLINFAEAPVVNKVIEGWPDILGLQFPVFAGFVTFALTGIFAIVGGIFADRLGRKRIVIIGFIILGIEYAVLSLFSTESFSWYIYICFDGAAWGMFAAVFFMTLWGDLSEDFEREKYYVLGGLPYLLAGFVQILIEPIIKNIESSNVTSAFSIASFFLFVAVLPLIYAPETLPEKTMKDRDLNSYIKKAKKVAEKESLKKQKPNKLKDKNEESSKETHESPEDKKARELAEKYY
jgi:MFS family permease